ncbi:hypothetical protein P3T76_001060 [Phytophthora citrophthora]|uniref:Uncharacterized protein n=1 Tax=Phytophthora citrophthora TaxID=4793 RepID=A0AAD9GXV7_9STRA|nr:hypothetical protein P3T76_001060 [Phytophthora citrophthora]
MVDLAQLSEKELDVKIRELENWNFRLNLDEDTEIEANVGDVLLTATPPAKEMQDSINIGIVEK